MPAHGRELEGQTALVTGGAHNIGRAICLALAEAGAAVCVNANSSGEAAEALAKEIETAGGRAMHYVANITDPEQVQTMVDAAAERLGGLTILVNNAAVRGNTLIEDMTIKEWRRVCNPTIEGTMLCSQAAVPHIRKAGGGTVICISGVAAFAGVAGRTHVGAAKAALIGFMKGLAHEVGKDNITVNTVSPGHIETQRGAAAGTRPDYGVKYLIGDRKGTPEEIAGMVRALCGPAGRYTTGETIHVNGGIYLPS